MSNSTTIPEKRCTQCGGKFPATVEYFYRDPRGKYDLYARCKSCHNEHQRIYRATNTEHARTYRATNAERRREYNRNWRATNTEHRREYDREYRQSPEGRVRGLVHSHNRRARERSLLNDFTAEQRDFALDYFNDSCAVCGRQFVDLFGERCLSFDHWIPLSSPQCPGTTATNIVPLCHGIDGCNSSKNNADPLDWLTRRFGKRKAREILARISAYFEIVRQRTEEASKGGAE